MTTPDDEFANIRPYHDDEVQLVLKRLAEDPELAQAILRFKFPQLASTPLIAPLLSWLVRRNLRRLLGRARSVRDVQLYVEAYMARMLAKSTDGMSVDGIEKLDPDQTYLFVSNHRDIAMDPALVNYALHTRGMNTVRIAIGDNLLKKPYVSDLMRLNKSFIVQRSAKGVRQVMAAFQQLSRYIDFSLHQEQHSIWIAQREGRAKNGIDRTDPAIIKMFCMAKKKERPFSEIIQQLNIVPVAISYEYDPLGIEKARELVMKQQDGSYAKSEFEDIHSIAQGIAGYKGRVHVAFGEPLQSDLADADAVAQAIDAQISRLYRLFPSHYLALEALGELQDIALPDFDLRYRAAFNQQLAACPEAYQHQWLAMYANPVKNYFNRLDGPTH